MPHDPDAFALDVRPERSIRQDGIDDAGHLLRAADPHANTGYVVARASWVRGRRDDVALRGERTATDRQSARKTSPRSPSAGQVRGVLTATASDLLADPARISDIPPEVIPAPRAKTPSHKPPERGRPAVQ